MNPTTDSETEQRSLPSGTTYPQACLPSIAEDPVEVCPVCSHSEYCRFAEGFDYELETCANLWQFVQCQKCRHVWLNPRPALSELSTIYPSHYYAYNYEAAINPLARWGKQQLDGRKLQSIIRMLGHLPSSFLDIGCGNGRFLQAVARAGVQPSRIFGLELDPNVVDALRAQGYQVWCRRVEDCSEIPSEAVELTTMFHVIEHVDDPKRVIEQIVSWLKPGGILALETPNLDSVDARWFRSTFWGGYHIPRHWNLFTPATLERLLAGAGLDVIRCRFLPGHSFWMYSFHHRLKYGTPNHRWLAHWFDPFRSLPMLTVFTGLDMCRGLLGAKTSSMLMIAQKPQ